MDTRLIKKKNGDYYCSKCRMKQPRLVTTCFFCGSLFSNYESALLEDFNDANYYLLEDDALEAALIQEAE